MKRLVNYTEEVVRDYVDQWFPQTDICQCDVCKLDIIAIMLNNLKPHYVVTKQGALFSQLNEFDPQYKVDLMSCMSKAVNIVKAHPRHDDSDD